MKNPMILANPLKRPLYVLELEFRNGTTNDVQAAAQNRGGSEPVIDSTRRDVTAKEKATLNVFQSELSMLMIEWYACSTGETGATRKVRDGIDTHRSSTEPHSFTYSGLQERLRDSSSTGWCHGLCLCLCILSHLIHERRLFSSMYCIFSVRTTSTYAFFGYSFSVHCSGPTRHHGQGHVWIYET